MLRQNRLLTGDANQQAAAFLVAQGAYIEAQVYERRFPEIQYPELIPVDNSAPEWTDSIYFFSEDQTGKADWYDDLADDMQMADVLRDQFSQAIHTAGVGYGYSLSEIMKAQQAGRNLDASRAVSARRRYEEFIDDLVFLGNAKKGWTGITNNTVVTRVDVAADGTGSSRLWSTKTADQINRDINDLLSAVWTSTGNVMLADTLLLPPAAWVQLGTTRIPQTGMTAFDFVMKNNAYTMRTQRPLTIRSIRGLDTQGAGGVGRMVAYQRDPDVVKIHIPMRHRFMAPVQVKVLRWVVPGIFRTGPVEIRLPAGVRYGDGIV